MDTKRNLLGCAIVLCGLPLSGCALQPVEVRCVFPPLPEELTETQPPGYWIERMEAIIDQGQTLDPPLENTPEKSKP